MININVPKGVRNNNPGNIKYNPNNDWKGAIGRNGKFVVFSNPSYGVRALSKTLDTYYNVHGLKSISSVIRRYAPSEENDTLAYIKFVSGRTGIAPGAEMDRLTFKSRKSEIMAAMIRLELGESPFTLAAITEWSQLS